jgi:hypothetical protein
LTSGQEIERTQTGIQFAAASAKPGSQSGSTMARRGGETDGLRPG